MVFCRKFAVNDAKKLQLMYGKPMLGESTLT